MDSVERGDVRLTERRQVPVGFTAPNSNSQREI